MNYRSWTMTWNGHTVTDDDLTNADLVTAQVLVNDGWGSGNPWASPLHAMSLMAAVIVRRTGEDLETVTAAISADKAGSLAPEPRTLTAVAG